MRQAMDNKGFTLIETLIATVILGVLVSVISNMYLTQHTYLERTNDLTLLQDNLNRAVDHMSVSVRESAFTDISGGASLITKGYEYFLDSDRLKAKNVSGGVEGFLTSDGISIKTFNVNKNVSTGFIEIKIEAEKGSEQYVLNKELKPRLGEFR